ncbi:MAG: hypothetical protein AAGF46_04750, partial [Pseudomonadota bacterium]
MSKDRAHSHLDFLARQLAQASRTQSLPEAFDSMRGHLPDPYLLDLERLRSIVVEGQAPKAGVGAQAFTVYPQLLSAISQEKSPLLFSSLAVLADNQRIIFSTYWAGLVSQLWYLGGLVVTALITTFVMVASVVPAFAAMFKGHGAELPALTRAVFQL